MPFQCEELTDRTEARKESLCAFRVAKASHATLAFARQLMTVLCAVDQSGRSLDEHVFHVRKFRDQGFCCRIAAQLIGDDLARQRARTQRTLEEAFGSGFRAAFAAGCRVRRHARRPHATAGTVRHAS